MLMNKMMRFIYLFLLDAGQGYVGGDCNKTKWDFAVEGNRIQEHWREMG
jgi:hypothetical protein